MGVSFLVYKLYVDGGDILSFSIYAKLDGIEKVILATTATTRMKNAAVDTSFLCFRSFNFAFFARALYRSV